MTTARLLATQSITYHQLSEFNEVGHAHGFVELWIELIDAAREAQVAPKLFAQILDKANGFG